MASQSGVDLIQAHEAGGSACVFDDRVGGAEHQ
jgi:hypothetical protein